jgi:hypothetical protein
MSFCNRLDGPACYSAAMSKDSKRLRTKAAGQLRESRNSGSKAVKAQNV